MHKPSLYLIPVTLGDTPVDSVLPAANADIVSRLKYFVVENVRSARRFLKKCNPGTDIDSLTFFELNTHTRKEEISGFLQPMDDGHDMGVISEAGCPAIADPGADVAAMAQRKGFRVVPLVGPSSILMALMASGFNGQSFAFHGYLPIEQPERIRKIKQLELRAYDENQSQIFIETPYRNQKLAEDILQHCRGVSQLCLAMNITCADEYIVARSVQAWKNKLPEMHKKPCVFILYRG